MIEILITSSVLIAVLALLRLVLRGRIHPGLQYALWGLVLLRLLVPVSWFQSPVSVMEAAEPALERVEAVYERPLSELPEYFVPPAPSGAETAPFRDLVSLESLAVGLWITGAVILGVWFAFVNFRLAAKLYRGRRLYSSNYPAAVYIAHGLPSPCLFAGEVYLTEEAAEDPARAEYIIAHELTHRRHGDSLWSALRVCCLAVYWFNPFVWLAASLSRRDCEIFCDAATVKKLGEEHRFDYGRTLLDMTAVTLRPADLICSATTMSGSGRTLRERIRLIARQSRFSAIFCVAAVLIAAIAVGCTFSGAKETAELSIPIQMSAAQPEPPVYTSTESADPQDERVNALMKNELYQYYMEYLAALGDDSWDKSSEYCWMDSKYAKDLSMEHHAPLAFASMIAFQHLSDDLIAVLMDMQTKNQSEPQEVLNFVGRVDGKPCVFRNPDSIPQPLQDSLQYLQLAPNTGEEELMSADGLYYDEVAQVFGPFLEPNLQMQLDRGGGYEVGPAPFDVTFEEFVYMTDNWEFTYYDEPIRLDLDSEGPSAIFSITAKDGTELYIFSDAGLYIGRNWEYSVHVTLGDLTGHEMIAMLYKWTKGELEPATEAADQFYGLPGVTPLSDESPVPILETPEFGILGVFWTGHDGPYHSGHQVTEYLNGCTMTPIYYAEDYINLNGLDAEMRITVDSLDIFLGVPGVGIPHYAVILEPDEYIVCVLNDGDRILEDMRSLLMETEFSDRSSETVLTSPSVSSTPESIPVITQLTITYQGYEMMDFTERVGAQVQLGAETYPQNDGIEFVWSSSDESVATVSQNGLVTITGSGYCTISVVAGDMRTTCIARGME